MKMSFIGSVVLVAVLWTTAYAEYLEDPNVLWTQDLPGGRSPRKGNAVVAKRDLIFVTANDGSLHIVNPSQLTETITFEPPPVPSSTTSCSSGVAFVENDTGSLEYALYAVVDIPDEVSVDTSSRLLGVNLDGSLRWEATVPGSAVGTPIVGTNKRVYQIHNEQIEGEPVGRVSVLDEATAEVMATLPDDDTIGPFGPATGRTVTRGTASLDVLLFAESRDDGLSENGALFMLLPSDRFEELNGQGSESFDFRTVTSSLRSVTTRPAVNADATEVFIAQQSSQLAGWTEDSDLRGVVQNGDDDIGDPTWDKGLVAYPQDPTSAIRTAPILSSDGSLLYVATNTDRLYCFEADEGSVNWIVTTTGTHAAEPVPHTAEGETHVVYFLESAKAIVRQYNADEGDLNWEVDCTNVSGDATCWDSVEAEFSLDAPGDVLYFADIEGKLVALEVAAFSTAAPTPVPSLSAPPTKAPTTGLPATAGSAPTPSQVKVGVSENKTSRKVPIILGTLFRSALAVFLIAVCIRRSQDRKHPAYGRRNSKLEDMTLDEITETLNEMSNPELNKLPKQNSRAMNIPRIGESTDKCEDEMLNIVGKVSEFDSELSLAAKDQEGDEEQTQSTGINYLDSWTVASDSTSLHYNSQTAPQLMECSCRWTCHSPFGQKSKEHGDQGLPPRPRKEKKSYSVRCDN